MSLNINEQYLKESIDPFLTVENLSEICARALNTSVQVRDTEILTGGCLNRVIGIDLVDDAAPLVLKASPKDHDPDLRHEFKVLEYFSRHTGMPVPLPVYFDDSGKRLPGTFYVMQKLEGKVMHEVRMSRSELSSVIAQIAEMVVELHSHKAEGFGGVEWERTSWPEFWLKRFDNRIGKARSNANVSAILLDRIDAVRPFLPKFLQIGSKSTLTHYDIWSGNILLKLANSSIQISGFLDVQGFWADYARELSFMEMFGIANQEFYEMYTSVFPLDPGFQLRKNIYNLKMNVVHIDMYPGEILYQLGAQECLRSIEEVIS